jgi:hypothetical protein
MSRVSRRRVGEIVGMSPEHPGISRNVREVAYCGLFCGNCVIRKGRIGEWSQELLGRLRTPEFRRLAAGLPKLKRKLFAPFRKYKEACEFLVALGHLDCEDVCREGGGTTGCKIRECCQAKRLDGCWKCAEFEGCRTLAWLRPVNADAHIRNLRTIRDRGMKAFLAGKKFW